jgi:hypothetical protein
MDYPHDLILDYDLMKKIKESITWGVTGGGRGGHAWGTKCPKFRRTLLADRK